MRVLVLKTALPWILTREVIIYKYYIYIYIYAYTGPYIHITTHAHASIERTCALIWHSNKPITRVRPAFGCFGTLCSFNARSSKDISFG